MSDLDDLMDELKQKRDELRVQVNLASKEVKEEWEELEEKMEEFRSKARLAETGKGLSGALGHLGHEIKLGYRRIRDAMTD